MGHTTNADVKKAPHTAQVHSKFKVFCPDRTTTHAEQLSRVDKLLQGFVTEKKVAAKSLGIEFLEATGQLVCSLGYRDDEPTYPVKLTSKSLGKLDVSPDAIGDAMTRAADDVENVICHEFYVTGDGEFVMVFLSHG